MRITDGHDTSNLIDSETFIVGNLDPTRKLQFNVGQIAIGATLTATVQNASGTLGIGGSDDTIKSPRVAELGTLAYQNAEHVSVDKVQIKNGITMYGFPADYGWCDLIGDITPKASGAGSPTLAVLTGHIRGFNYAAGDDGDCLFHIPHDYAPGTNLYLHPHWTHNGTDINGSLVLTVYATYAKGHQQASFASEITTTITDGSLSYGNTPALWHRIPEIQLSTPGGSASMLNTTNIEVDGLILINFDVLTIPGITGGTGKPFLLTFDLHYQSTGINTKNKAPNFYA